MTYWLGFGTGAVVVTTIFAVWYVVSNKLVEVTLEKDDAANT